MVLNSLKRTVNLLKRISIRKDYLFGIIIVTFGFLLLIAPVHSEKSMSSIQIADELLLQTRRKEPPVQIIIPSLGIDIPVKESKIIKGYWELAEDSASFGLGSAYPGEKGNTVIFAHARKGLFYDLKEIKEKDTIYILTNNKWMNYSVSQIKVVTPDQTEIISQTEKETLTLYTCSGFSDQKRLIVVAYPER